MRHDKMSMGAKASDRVYQFKVTLQGIRPPIWRRILVPATYTFWDLHVAIQDVMGWLDYHLHEFRVHVPRTGKTEDIGFPNDEFPAVRPGWAVKLVNRFTMKNRVAQYEYDFGDGWEHLVELEAVLPREPGVTYPVCVKGKRACPPEDCGGTSGYAELLRVVADPGHEEHAETMEWLGGDFDPERFDAAGVRFDDPNQRLRLATGPDPGI